MYTVKGKRIQYSVDMQLSVTGVNLAAKQHIQLHIIVVQLFFILVWSVRKENQVGAVTLARLREQDRKKVQKDKIPPVG